MQPHARDLDWALSILVIVIADQVPVGEREKNSPMGGERETHTHTRNAREGRRRQRQREEKEKETATVRFFNHIQIHFHFHPHPHPHCHFDFEVWLFIFILSPRCSLLALHFLWHLALSTRAVLVVCIEHFRTFLFPLLGGYLIIIHLQPLTLQQPVSFVPILCSRSNHLLFRLFHQVPQPSQCIPPLPRSPPLLTPTATPTAILMATTASPISSMT